MGRRRCALKYEKDQAGCIWGLISIFDFRYSRSTRKLLSDKRHESRNATGSSGVGTKLKMLTNSDDILKSTEKKSKVGEESEILTDDVVKTSVKELMEEEMFIEKDSKNRIEPEKKPYTESCGVNTIDFEEARNSGAENLDNLDLQGIIEELCQYYQKNPSIDFDMCFNDPHLLAEKNLSEAIKVFIDQRFNEEGKTRHSKEFVEALKTLSLNKEMFLNLLKDLNSPLVKHIQSIDDARLGKSQSNSRTHRSFFKRRSKSQESNPLEGNEEFQPSNQIVILKPGPTERQNPNNETSNVEDDNKVISERNASQFSFTGIKRKLKHARRSKSQESNPLEGNEEFQPSNQIVVLKPGPTERQNPNNETSNVEDDNKVKSERNASQFSFTGIKRKLKHAMGKEKLGESRNPVMSEKGVLDERVGWSSPNRNHFYTENFTKPSNASKKEEKISKTLGVSSIYIEAKKHLSDVLTNGDKKEATTRQLPKTLGRILTLPEYNFSPWGSPGKEGDAGFITAQMRLSPRFNIHTQRLVQEDNAIHLNSPKQEMDDPNEKEESRNSGSNVIEENPLGSFVENETSFEGGVGTIIETGGVLDVLCEESGSLITSDDQNHDTDEVCEEERSYLCLKEDSIEEDPSFSSPLVSPSSSSQTKKSEDRDSAIDKTERPSPVSVLEPFFTEDEISPSTTKTRPTIQPLQICFDEGMCTRAREENEESAFEYVEAVLLASGLNWDEYISNWLSSNQLLHQSLFDEVELFSNRSFDDQKLLFDCTNEVLKEICERYIGYSFVKHKIRPVPSGTNLIQEVWEGVEWHLLYYPPPRSLDQLVKKDMVKPGTWMDLGFETENIVVELENLVLEEMVEETLFSL